MPKIWRVENDNGQGCYTSQDDNGVHYFYGSPLEEHTKENGHPPPLFDRGIERNPLPKEYCGFKTEEQARKWFSKEELQWLESFGFYLQEIEVDVITAIGKYQVLAIKNLQNVDELNFCLP